MMLILVMAFFMLGCRFSCSGMKEYFAWTGGCDCASAKLPANKNLAHSHLQTVCKKKYGYGREYRSPFNKAKSCMR
jgi:hypothetical protein